MWTDIKIYKGESVMSQNAKKLRNAMLAAVAVSALSIASPVVAQGTAAPVPEEQGGVQDIVVTAQRREGCCQSDANSSLVDALIPKPASG